jgi:hypothetical protein
VSDATRFFIVLADGLMKLKLFFFAKRWIHFVYALVESIVLAIVIDAELEGPGKNNQNKERTKDKLQTPFADHASVTTLDFDAVWLKSTTLSPFYRDFGIFQFQHNAVKNSLRTTDSNGARHNTITCFTQDSRDDRASLLFHDPLIVRGTFTTLHIVTITLRHL